MRLYEAEKSETAALSLCVDDRLGKSTDSLRERQATQNTHTHTQNHFCLADNVKFMTAKQTLQWLPSSQR